MNKSLKIIIVIIILAIGAYIFRGTITAYFFKPNESVLIEEEIVDVNATSTIVASNLSIPWEMVFLPNGDMLVTERPGNLLRISKGKQDAIKISGVEHRGEGGLLGLALDPNFKENNFIYLYLTTLSEKTLTNQVERYKLDGTKLTDREVIFMDIPGSSNHDGGRIAFGPDELLYITTGDAGREATAQDTAGLAGKILRIHPNGIVPTTNPFSNAVYSYGHRNIQGIAWDESGQLWATEHGRSGTRTGYDELNKIISGENYGWPIAEGDKKEENMISPEIHSGAEDTWAPAGMTIYKNHIFFTGLRGESIYTVNIENGEAKDLKKYLTKEYGRLRSVTLGPDNMLYILTNNRDGRGNPRNGDDKIIKINPDIFLQ